MITPSTAMLSPGSTLKISPSFICSAGTILSVPSVITRPVFGVRCTSFSIPALALATVRSSNRAPICMIKATSPAAKVSPINTDAIMAMDTSTSALMSNSVTRPIIASMIIGSPQRIMAIHAISKGKGSIPSRFIARAIPDITIKAISFLVPPISISSSSLPIASFILHLSLH